jgi:hypothetical protein
MDLYVFEFGPKVTYILFNLVSPCETLKGL